MGRKSGFAVGGFSAGLTITKDTANYYPGTKTDGEMETYEAGGGVTWVIFEQTGEITADLGDEIWIQVARNTNCKAMYPPE